MLSKMIERGAQHLLVRQAFVQPALKMLVVQPTRSFRSDYNNPYRYDPTPISEYEREKQQELPVWDRVFDFKKYMDHEGPLKVIKTSRLTVSLVVHWPFIR